MIENVSQGQMQSSLRDIPDDYQKFKISVLRNCTVEPGTIALRYAFFLKKIHLEMELGGYDTMQQEALGLSSEDLFTSVNAVLVFTSFSRLSPRLAESFAALSPDEVAQEIDRVCKYLSDLFLHTRKQAKAFILWHSIELPVFPAMGIAESFADQPGQCHAVQSINARVAALLSEMGNAAIVNMNLPLLRLGYTQYYDARLWHMGRIPYSWKGFIEIVKEEMKYLSPLVGHFKKCLVMDCDNTLWHGIVGEDGMSGIRMGDDYPGSCFRELQLAALELYHRGVILAICSKNNEQDVIEVLETHPEMRLKPQHFAARRINWQSKSQNIYELSKELNIGLDSMVFIDDNIAEIELVKEHLPEVHVLHFSKTEWLHARDLLLSGLFDVPHLSQEDRNRGKMYYANSERKKLQEVISNLDDYYRSLEMEVTIARADQFSIPRIAQQTQKTNQFNLTTRRYTEDAIKELAECPQSDVFWLSVADKFGDLGIVGTCIVRYNGEDAVIDSLLLSCRVIGRCLEDIFLYQVLLAAKSKNARRAIGLFCRTAKNQQVAAFYPDRKFIESRFEAKADGIWELNLTGELQLPPDVFKSRNIKI